MGTQHTRPSRTAVVSPQPLRSAVAVTFLAAAITVMVVGPATAVEPVDETGLEEVLEVTAETIDEASPTDDPVEELVEEARERLPEPVREPVDELLPPPPDEDADDEGEDGGSAPPPYLPESGTEPEPEPDGRTAQRGAGVSEVREADAPPSTSARYRGSRVPLALSFPSAATYGAPDAPALDDIADPVVADALQTDTSEEPAAIVAAPAPPTTIAAPVAPPDPRRVAFEVLVATALLVLATASLVGEVGTVREP